MVNKKESHETGDQLCLIGFVMGILSIILVVSNGLVIGLVGILISMTQQRRKPTKFGRLGVILNLIGILLGILAAILLATVLKSYLQTQLGNFPVQ